jgi:hypothetical protein
MAIVVEMHNTGDPAIRSEIAAAIEHVRAVGRETGKCH